MDAGRRGLESLHELVVEKAEMRAVVDRAQPVQEGHDLLVSVVFERLPQRVAKLRQFVGLSLSLQDQGLLSSHKIADVPVDWHGFDQVHEVLQVGNAELIQWSGTGELASSVERIGTPGLRINRLDLLGVKKIECDADSELVLDVSVVQGPPSLAKRKGEPALV